MRLWSSASFIRWCCHRLRCIIGNQLLIRAARDPYRAHIPNIPNRSVPPVTRPVPPLTRPVPPLTRPVPPLTRPVPPLTRPVPPLTRPVPPLTRPVPPLTRPVPPLTRPVPPLTRPVPPLTRPVPPLAGLVCRGGSSRRRVCGCTRWRVTAPRRPAGATASTPVRSAAAYRSGPATWPHTSWSVAPWIRSDQELPLPSPLKHTTIVEGFPLDA